MTVLDPKAIIMFSFFLSTETGSQFSGNPWTPTTVHSIRILMS